MNTFNYEQIDQYLMGQLQGENLRSFERQMESDPDLAQEVADRRKSLDILEDLGDLQLKKRIKVIHNKVVGSSEREATPEKVTKVRPLYRWIAVAATFLLLISAFLWWSNRALDNQQLFAQHYEPYNISFTNRSADVDTRLADASRLYKNGNFQQVIGLLESYLQDTTNTKATLALGIAAIELNHYDKAIQYFDQLIEAKDPLYEEQAIWYKALTYLKQDDAANCKTQLNLLTQERFSFRKADAQQLLNQLN